MKRGIKILAVVGLVALVAGPAGAGIQINFTDSVSRSSNTDTPGQQVGGISGTSWNDYSDGTGGVSGLLVDDSGAATTVTVDVGVEDGDESGVIDWGLSGSLLPHDLGNIFGDGLSGDDIYDSNAQSAVFENDYGRGIAVRVSGLDAGTWDLYVVGRNTNNDGEENDFDQYDVYVASLPAINPATDTTNVANDLTLDDTLTNSFPADPGGNAAQNVANAETDNWVDGETFVLASVDVAAGEDLVVFMDPVTTDEDRGFINTLQLVPEPATLALVGMGLGGLLLRRRRR